MKEYGKAMLLKVYLMNIWELHTQMNHSQVISIWNHYHKVHLKYYRKCFIKRWITHRWFSIWNHHHQVHLKYYKRCFIKSLIQLYLVLLFVYLCYLLYPCYYPCFICYHFLALFWASQVMLMVKNLPANAGDTRDMGSISGSGRFPGEGNSNPLQYSCLKNLIDRGALTKSQTRLKRLSMHAAFFYKYIIGGTKCSLFTYFLNPNNFVCELLKFSHIIKIRSLNDAWWCLNLISSYWSSKFHPLHSHFAFMAFKNLKIPQISSIRYGFSV